MSQPPKWRSLRGRVCAGVLQCGTGQAQRTKVQAASPWGASATRLHQCSEYLVNMCSQALGSRQGVTPWPSAHPSMKKAPHRDSSRDGVWRVLSKLMLSGLSCGERHSGKRQKGRGERTGGEGKRGLPTTQWQEMAAGVAEAVPQCLGHPATSELALATVPKRDPGRNL